MTDMAESSSMPSKIDKPLVLRVKRKAFQSPLEALWLEINERPVKRPLLDFGNLSLSDSSAKAEEPKVKKVFVQRVETVSTSEVPLNVLQSFVPDSVNTVESDARNEEKRRSFKSENKQGQLLLKSKQKQEALAKNARFEQIWNSRKGKKDAIQDGALHEMYNIYDIVRVDEDETSSINEQKQEEEELEDHRLMSSFLPLLREFVPSAAEEIETDIHDFVSKPVSKVDYVYDLYAVKDDVDISHEDALNPFPLVQVDDDDGFYDGIDGSEYASDDSNAENNPLNEYPDEESSTENEETESKDSDEEESEEHEIASYKSSQAGRWKHGCDDDHVYDDDDDDFDEFMTYS